MMKIDVRLRIKLRQKKNRLPKKHDFKRMCGKKSQSLKR